MLMTIARAKAVSESRTTFLTVRSANSRTCHRAPRRFAARPGQLEVVAGATTCRPLRQASWIHSSSPLRATVEDVAAKELGRLGAFEILPSPRLSRASVTRSEERRVGKEGRSRWS